jgi:hypothetical protein
MLITFDTDSLREHNLSAAQYFYLILIAENKQDLLKEYLDRNYPAEDCTIDPKKLHKELLEKDLFIEPGSDWIATEKTKNIIFGDNLFKEFVAEFPQSVTRTDGTIDFLRTDLSNAETAYKCYIGRSRDKHNHIMKCLKAEIKNRTSNGSMPYMKRILTWITSKAWTSYEDSLDAILTPNKDLGYGTNLI